MRLFRSRRPREQPSLNPADMGLEFQTVKAVPALVFDDSPKEKKKSKLLEEGVFSCPIVLSVYRYASEVALARFWISGRRVDASNPRDKGYRNIYQLRTLLSTSRKSGILELVT